MSNGFAPPTADDLTPATTFEELETRFRQYVAVVEDRLNSLELVLVQLMNGYAEISVGISALTDQVLGSSTEEERQQFITLFRQQRNEIFKTMREAASHVASDGSGDTFSPLEHLGVEEESSMGRVESDPAPSPE